MYVYMNELIVYRIELCRSFGIILKSNWRIFVLFLKLLDDIGYVKLNTQQILYLSISNSDCLRKKTSFHDYENWYYTVILYFHLKTVDVECSVKYFGSIIIFQLKRMAKT